MQPTAKAVGGHPEEVSKPWKGERRTALPDLEEQLCSIPILMEKPRAMCYGSSPPRIPGERDSGRRRPCPLAMEDALRIASRGRKQ